MFPPDHFTFNLFFKVQVHVEDDPERIYKATEVGITSSFVNQITTSFIRKIASSYAFTVKNVNYICQSVTWCL